MALTEASLAELRSIIGHGEPPSNEELNTAFVRLGSVPAVALEVQRSRLAQLRSQPARLTIDGDRTEGWEANINSLERHVGALEVAVEKSVHPSSGQAGIGQFVRVGRSR